MEKILKHLIEKIEHGQTINADKLNSIIRYYNRGIKEVKKQNAKKHLLPYYLINKKNNTQIYKSWNITKSTENKLINLLKVKPTRSASGVATITVITKPQKCGGNCVFCPNDIRMPKSYLSNEPACQRAERNFFDPYLQVQTRLKALHEMGHNTDKVELIVLGGTWSDYSQDYQKWFICELFKAINDGLTNIYDKNWLKEREQFYKDLNFENDTKKLEENARYIQEKINNGLISYNKAYEKYYETNDNWKKLSKWQKATLHDVYKQHKLNECSKHRCVGLVIETRPAAININNLNLIRKLGCTKVQIGVQSLDYNKMKACNRKTLDTTIKKAFELLRLYGFKIHAHFMANLLMSNPEKDKEDFKQLVKNKNFLPDEIKLYPCMLVESAHLNKLAKKGLWKAYSEEKLLDVLVDDVVNTPAYTRISRMMRDISSTDILQGVKKTNLRQVVEQSAEKYAKENNVTIEEIRHREISLNKTNIENIIYSNIKYETSVSIEYFLQYTNSENKILGFLRLSLPKNQIFKKYLNLPICEKEAMIREVHVYGKVANLGESSSNAQHLGLGKKLIKKACDIAKKHNYLYINVISAIGTRQYYKARGFNKFSKNKMYQQKALY